MSRILVVDDIPVSRALIKDALEPQNYEILEAASGPDALALMANIVPDLILLDIQMPLMDGYGLVNLLRKDMRLRDLPVAAVTALAMRGDREKAIAFGFDAYITKPIDIHALRAEVRSLLDNRKAP
ncbi:MAG: response regulator [Bryobacteraceae bacterium]